MNGKFILISGSAGRSCSARKLDIAHRFVRSFTEEVLRRGGGIVVLAGDEESAKDERGKARIFDWVALREVERYAKSTTKGPRVYARIAMSNEAPKSKIDEANLGLLTNLQQRNLVEICRIPREIFTGGKYRRAMIEMADVMLAISGGKGTYSAGVEMLELGRPVLPLDLKLGSTADDSYGGVDLHREMTTDPARFFPKTYQDVTNKVEMFSLDREINDVESVARVSAEILARELDSIPPLSERRTNANGRLATVWRFGKELSVVTYAIKIFEWIKGIFPFM